jgi:hypothetical protein
MKLAQHPLSTKSQPIPVIERPSNQMVIRRIQLRNIVASNQPRPLVTSEVNKLATSINEVGLIQPITLREAVVVHNTAERGWQIVAGHHRVAACRALGWTEIDAIVLNSESTLQTDLIEIDENLCRAELTAAQRSTFSKRRKQIWEALYFGTQVGNLCPPEKRPVGNKSPPPQTKGFAAATAKATGMKKRSLNQHVARAEALGEDILTKVTNTSLDSGVELEALGKLPESERTELVERAAAGETVSARHQYKRARPNKQTQKQKESEQNAIDAHGDSDPIAMLEEAMAENEVLRKQVEALTKADSKAETLKWMRLNANAEMQRDDAMARAVKMEAELQRFAKRLRRIGEAVGESDFGKVAALVEAMVRNAKAASPDLPANDAENFTDHSEDKDSTTSTVKSEALEVSPTECELVYASDDDGEDF